LRKNIVQSHNASKMNDEEVLRITVKFRYQNLHIIMIYKWYGNGICNNGI